MIENTNVQEINKAIFILKELNADEKMRYESEMREKALHDEASVYNSAHMQGEQIGMQKGIQIGKQEGIQLGIDETKKVFRLYLQGYTAEQISEKLGMTEEKVREIIE